MRKVINKLHEEMMARVNPVDEEIKRPTWVPEDDFTYLPEDVDVINPEHYRDLPGGAQVHDVIAHVVNRNLGFTEHISYCDLGNAIKYLLRLGQKNGTLEEAKKAQWYLNKLIEREEL